MDKRAKILLIIFLILIAAVSVSLGYLLTNPNKKIAKNTANLTNQTNNTTKNYSTVTNRTKTTKTSNSGFISAQKAINIVKHSIPSVNCSFSAELISSANPPFYLVTAYDNNPKSPYYGESVGGAKVDAKTGKILFAMG